MHAADQQALAVAGGQELDGVGDARGAAGQHHDAVGVLVQRHLFGRHLPDKPDEPAAYRRDRRHDAENQQASETPQASPPRRAGRGRHSRLLSVCATVRREVPAVTAATRTTRPRTAPYPSRPSDRLPNSALAWLSPAVPLNQSAMMPTSANRAMAAMPPTAPPLRPTSRKWRWNSPAMNPALAPTTYRTSIICRLVDIAPRVANITDSIVAASTSASMLKPIATALRAIARMRSTHSR